MHTKNIQREISRVMFDDERVFKGGEPLFTAYGCVLLERNIVDKYYVYTAVNLTTDEREVIARRIHPLTTSQVEGMAEKIRLSSVAGAGWVQADRPYGQNVPIKNCREMLTDIFTEILPERGYAVRKEQIALAEHILDAIYRRQVTLAEAEVGTGKTLAYLVAAILAKRARLNGYWNMSFYTGSAYVDMAHMPIVIATSSIALQKALVSDYIPELSKILLDYSVIIAPLTAVIRKGREHYVCEHKLRAHIPFEHNAGMKEILEGLLKPNAKIDLAETDDLTPHVKRKISVPDRCDNNCPHRDKCPYLRFRKKAQNSEIDIQVCNHNYLLADTLRRANGERPLIPNYQSVIIDEAHKFLSAARSMYGTEFSGLSLPEIKDSIFELSLKQKEIQKRVRKTAKKLSDGSDRLFSVLVREAQNDDLEDESDRRTAVIGEDAARFIRNIHILTRQLIETLDDAAVSGRGEGRKAQILWDLEQVRKQTAALVRHDKLICWLEDDKDGLRLRAVPKDLDKQLYNDLWSKGVPTILTSGTLSASGDFSHIKRTLGLELVGNRLTETSKPSPFDYRKNSLLYISENVPFPDQRSQDYILAVANEIEELIRASHGHAAVLFTSYRAMDMVWEDIKERGLPFPMFRLDKGGVREIERFKRSGNGILFASGALWEGIDIPGDALSMLIIVKLPFAVPDSISEYERTLYEDMDEYKELVITPEMLVKLKQGYGRGLRIETDTVVVAILDCRAAINGAYRIRVINALPDCEVTDSIDDVEDFYREKKTPGYFE